MIIHHIWLGPNPFPVEFQRYREAWLRLYPLATLMLHRGPENLKHFVNRESYNEAKTWSQKSDILRYEILFQYGGIYVDTDLEPLQYFVFPENFAGWECSDYVGTAIIGAKAKNMIIAQIIGKIQATFDPVLPPNVSTGPHLFTRNVVGSSFTLFDKSVFYPNGFGGVINGPLESAVTDHKWRHSWK